MMPAIEFLAGVIILNVSIWAFALIITWWWVG
jgi:hypothetical protein